MTKKAEQKINPIKNILIVLSSIIILLIIGYFGVSYYIADVMTQPYHNVNDISPLFVAPTHQDISFLASDGIHLKGWFFKNPSSNKLVIFVAGISSNIANADYFGSFIAHELYEKGYSILMYDSRSVGSSELTRLDFGERRGNDILGAVQFGKLHGFEGRNIAIIGDSLGAISTLMVIEKLNDIGAIILDSAAADMEQIIESKLQTDKHIPSFFNPGIFFMAKLFYDIDVNNIKPINHLILVPDRKILFIHGRRDTYIPLSNSIRLKNRANPESRLVIFDKAEHVESYKTGPELYRKEVFGWIDQELGK